ncbi:3-hydroxyacyl-CoA dehydrogenase family protein [Salirhabdus euzebyi]|uniref:3-hydroxyacyl-CoA dehydrogenase family protein n=1 Tax=Salirhabdus euzebyi TaxID=394506 RepID=UPI00157A2FF2|nr:3-hydroxyacyl-CoA dehydrogenase family protein [Salirhabdus euzebyi]
MNQITVLGAGTMGHGIAQNFAMINKKVTLYDIHEQAIERAIQSIKQNLESSVKIGKLETEQAAFALRNISTSLELKTAVKDSNLVIEAVPENMELKKDIFRQLDFLTAPHTLLATNTSELSVTAIASATNRPDKVIGMHWFNPAPIMKLIEIVKGVNTSEETIKAIEKLSKELGKITIAVKDSQGFVTTRALAAHMLECMRMLEEGVASAQDIDTGVKYGLNYPMGPLELADLVGLDTMLFASEGLAQAYGDRFRAPQILHKLVEAGHLGRKAGKGFYHYKGE